MNYIFTNIDEQLKAIEKKRKELDIQANFLGVQKKYNELLDLEVEGFHIRLVVSGGYVTFEFKLHEVYITSPNGQKIVETIDNDGVDLVIADGYPELKKKLIIFSKNKPVDIFSELTTKDEQIRNSRNLYEF